MSLECAENESENKSVLKWEWKYLTMAVYSELICAQFCVIFIHWEWCRVVVQSSSTPAASMSCISSAQFSVVFLCVESTAHNVLHSFHRLEIFLSLEISPSISTSHVYNIYVYLLFVCMLALLPRRKREREMFFNVKILHFALLPLRRVLLSDSFVCAWRFRFKVDVFTLQPVHEMLVSPSSQYNNI